MASVATLQPSSNTAVTSPHVSTSSASGLLSLLTEPDATLVTLALSKLLATVDTLWHEVAEVLPLLEEIAEGGSASVISEDVAMSVSFDAATCQTAAALASRVFFHLEEPKQALRLALESGEHFQRLMSASSEDFNDRDRAYAERLVNCAIGEYVASRRKEFDEFDNTTKSAAATAQDQEEEQLDIDKLQLLVSHQFQKCYREKSYAHALGVAMEARELARVQEVLDRLVMDNTTMTCTSYELIASVLKYALDSAEIFIDNKVFRGKALEAIGLSLGRLIMPDHIEAPDSVTAATNVTKHSSITPSAKRIATCTYVKCMQLLKSSSSVGKVLTLLLQSDNDDEVLLGLQLCFDTVDSGDQKFVTEVAKCLLNLGTDPSNEDAILEGGQETPSGDNYSNESTNSRLLQAHRVLTQGFTSELSLSFLYKNSNSDVLIMSNLKKSLEERGMGRNSMLHNCALTTHAYLNLGTTNDGFLRDNLDWMKKASNWAKFSATASMGVIHAGHTSEAMTLLEPYLPPSSPDDATTEHPSISTTGGFAEGGSLYALGLIHGSHVGSSATKRLEASIFLRRHLRNSHVNEVISHGAALGVGLTNFGSGDLDVVHELKDLLQTDNAVAGEAASLAIGMVLVGTGAGNVSSSSASSPDQELLAEIVTELRNYSRETQHEKIIRGIAICIALINFGQEDNADVTIEEMRGDRDPIIRYGAMYGLALAYCGTGSNKAVRILLHTAVSDVSDDVRMASVIGLALVVHKTPNRVPELVRLLLESFNPHVRYASCMAVGIAMAGTGDTESVALLEPMLTDMTDFVRQGALLGTSMIYMQQSDTCNHKKIKSFREKLASIISDKHQSTLTKMGAILSTGIIDVGGRNCALHLGSRDGFTKMNNAAGLVLWLQHWHWFPMMHMLSIAVTPTCTIGLNKDFKYPKKFDILCNARPSTFAYPKKLEEKKEEKKKRVETVALSITAKNKARLARKKAKEEAESSETDGAMDIEKNVNEGKEEGKVESMDVDEEDKDVKSDLEKSEEKLKKKREPEVSSFRIPNPSRITKAQACVCVFDLNQRYRPIRPEEKPYGVIMLTDSTPGEVEDLGAVVTPAQEEEAEPPEPFEWIPPGHPEHPDTTMNDTNISLESSVVDQLNKETEDVETKEGLD